MARRLAVMAGLLLGASLLGPAQQGAPRDSSPAPELKLALTRALQARVNDLLSEKDAQGLPFRRGRYATRFTEAGGGAWSTMFHRETVKDDSLLVERLLVTLAPDGSGRDWHVSGEKVLDTYDALSRDVPGDEEFARFSRFVLEREGLRLAAGAGFLYKDFRKGRVERVVLRGAAMEQVYKPPVPADQIRHALLVEDHPEDFDFTPEEIRIACDPDSCDALLASAFEGLAPAAAPEIDEELRRTYEKSVRDIEQERRQDPFAGFRLPWDPDRRRLAVLVKKKDKDHWLVLDSDSADPEENTVYVSGYGPVYMYPAEKTRSSVAPAEIERRPDSGRRDVDVEGVSGTVELGFGDGQVLTGDITVILRTRRELRVLFFELARLNESRKGASEAKRPRMTINSMQDGEQNELTWASLGPTSGFIVFPAAVPAGTPLTLHVEFENRDCVYKFTPYYFYVARAGWLPFLDGGDMLQTFDLTVKVPAKFTALGVGAKVTDTKEQNASVTRWSARESVSFPTVIFGGYKEATAKVKTAKKDGTPIPVVMHIDRDSVGSVSPDAPQKMADQAAASLDLFQRLFDVDYPFGKLDLVNDPGESLAGQAPSSLVFLGSGYTPAYRGPGQMTKAEVSRFERSLVPHEVAHQWWGSLVGASSPRHRWFEEALAEYSSGLYMQAAQGLEGYITRVQDWRKEVIETRMLTPVQDEPLLWDFDGAYHAAMYAKGPYVFHMMRSIWGDDRFFTFLRALAHDHRGKEIVTRDIQRLSEKYFGEKMDWFYDQWVRGVGIPEYTLRHTIRPGEGGGVVVEGKVEQRVLASPKLRPRRVIEGQAFRAVVYLSATLKDGRELQHRLDIKGPVTAFAFTLPDRPKSIVLNKYGETLAHDVILATD